MSIIVSDLTYRHPNQQILFSHLNFSAENRNKISIVGNNGIGKSTFLKLIAGKLQVTEGTVISSAKPYYVPQHTGLLNQSIAEVLGVNKKLKALSAILNGSVSPEDYEILNDDWDIETRCQTACSYWNLPLKSLEQPIDSLSGGEKTKVFLAGILIHSPEIILLDEPSNHLDQTGRELLYEFVRQSKATIILVSHDITLLNLIETTCELSEHGLKLYGGNYDFYKEQKEIERNALSENIHEQEKAFRLAKKQAQEVKQRQERRTAQQGEKNKSQVPRIMRNTLRDSSENTAARLKGKHAEILNNSLEKLAELKQQKELLKELKMDFDDTVLHAGKLLIEASQINFAYPEEKPLWKNPLDFKLYSNDRIHILGNNGSGKTTFIKLLTGSLLPSTGNIKRTNFEWIYLDQNYSQTDVDCSIVELAEKYNRQSLKDHEIKLRLNRFLFPSDTWDKNCKTLSGGEKMRLFLCCLMINQQTPDLIILDEPTNNLDISSLQILSQTIKNYKGSLLVISHDQYFVSEIGVTQNLKF